MHLNYDVNPKALGRRKRNYSRNRYIKLIEAFEESGKNFCEIMLDADDKIKSSCNGIQKRLKEMKKPFKVSIRGKHLYLYKEM